jgi:HEAT repeat protein
MFPSRCSPPRPAGRPLGRAALFAAGLVWFALQQPGGAAEPAPPDNVEQFRVFLRDDVARLGKLSYLAGEATKMKLSPDTQNNKDKLAFYTNLEAKLLDEVGRDEKTPGKLTLAVNKRFDELEARLTHLGELAGVERLAEWGLFETLDGMARADAVLPAGSTRNRTTGMLKTIDDKFVAAVGAAAGGDRRGKIALCAFLGEEANQARRRKSAGYHYRSVLMQTVPTVVAFSKEKGPENRPLREAATTALSLMDAEPDQLMDAVKELLAVDGKEDVNSRRIAYAALRRPFQMVSPRSDPYYQGIAVTTDPLTKPGDRYLREPRVVVEQLGPKAVEQLAKGLDPKLEADPEVRLTCVEAYRDLTAMLLDPNRLPTPSGAASKNVPYFENVANTYRSITNLMPLFEALRDSIDGVVDAGGDPDTGIRTEALAALRDLVEFRNRYQGWRAEFQRFSKEAPKGAQAVQDQPDLSKPLPDPLSKGVLRGVRAVAASLKHPDPDVRLAALEVLEELGADAEAAQPAVIGALGDRDKFVRWAAVRILGRFAPRNAKEVVPALLPLVGTPDGDFARAVAGLLAKYGEDAAPAVPALAKAIRSGEPQARIAYLQTLPAIGPAAADAVPSMRQLLRPDPKGARIAPSPYPPAFAPSGPPKYDDPGVRAAAAEALGRFGPLAKAAEPELREALNDEDTNVRRAAADALLRIRGK